MRPVSGRSGGETRNTCFVFNSFYPPENHAVYEVMWKNIKPDRLQIKIWFMFIACWIPKATNTYSEYVTLIAFPLLQWWHEHALMLRYTYITCLVYVTGKL